MTTFKLLAGVAAGILLHSAAADAQQAPPASSTECSGLHCLLGWHFDNAPAQPDQPPAAEARSVGAGAAQANVPKPSKPVHVIKIAATAPEAARLAGLTAAMPKTKVKIVKTETPARETASDFMVAPTLGRSAGLRLFTEQLHVVAGSRIHELRDLDGKVVSFGPDQSASQATARKLFAALDIKVQETPLDLDNALDGLTTGDLDAVVVLAPQPVARLKSLSAPGVHLVSWPVGDTPPDGTRATQIEASTYPGLAAGGAPIRTIGVEASLLPSTRGAKDAAAKSFLKALAQNSDALAKRGFDLIKADAGHDRHLASAER